MQRVTDAAASEFDVVVVGGGPAGAATAALLAREGFAVGLVDRARFPRDKACGEFLTPGAVAELRALGAWEAILAAGATAVHEMRLGDARGVAVRRAAPDGSPVGYTLRRTAVDAALLRVASAAGAVVIEGAAVRAIQPGPDGRFSVEIDEAPAEHQGARAELEGLGIAAAALAPLPSGWGRIRTRLVVGADGTHSRIARQLGLARPIPRLCRVAVVTHWPSHGVSPGAIEMRAAREIVVGMAAAGPDGSLNLTLVAPTRASTAIAGRPVEFVEEILDARFPDVAARLGPGGAAVQARTVGCFGHTSRPYADGVLLVGDAASFIDPFTGEGIYFALRGAELAAEVASAALRAGDVRASALQRYAAARRELDARYRLCDLVQAVVRRPALYGSVLRRLERRPDVRDRLLGVLSDLHSTSQVLHPLFVWRLVAPSIGE